RFRYHHTELVHLRPSLQPLQRGLLSSGRHGDVRDPHVHHRPAVSIRGEEGALLMSTTTVRPRPTDSPAASPPSTGARAGRPKIRLRRTWWAFLLLVATALVVIVPLYRLVSSAFKTNGEIYACPMRFLPSELTWANLSTAWALAPFGAFIKSSLLVTAVGAAAKVVLAVFTAYAFAFLPFPGKKGLFLVMLGALMVPGHVTLLVNYITIGNMGLINTRSEEHTSELQSRFELVCRIVV